MSEEDPFTLENVWRDKSEALQEEIVAYWLAQKALPSREQAVQRLPQVIMLLRDAGGAIAAVSTVYRQHNRQLNHPFFYFRCFVSPEQRRKLLAARLIVSVRDFLNARFAAGSDPDVIGMIVEAENEGLNSEHRQAVWPHSGFVFIGLNGRGQQVRVYYFDGARI